MSSLLSGVRVVEVAVLLNGDHLGGLLADYGADVIKVEAPGRGDYIRDMLGQVSRHNSPAHIQVNKNKRSITIDVGRDSGREVFYRLLATSDVFVDGLRAGTCDKLGIGYEAQRAQKPDIVYCHFSGFGAKGPYSPLPTHGQMMNSLAGATPVEMSGDGFVHRARSDELMDGTTTGGSGTSVGAAHAAAHVAAALWRRERTGEGAYIDVSGADAVIASAWIGAVYGWNEERISDWRDLRLKGQPEFTGARYQWYQTGDDRYILFCCIEHGFWERFCRAVERQDLITGDDSRQTAGSGPVDFAHGDAWLRHELQTIFAGRTQSEWMNFAIQSELPIGPSYNAVRSLLDDAHLRSRNIVVEGVDPDGAPFVYVGEPAVVDGTAYTVARPAPGLGQHTEEVLAELGYDGDQIAALQLAGAV